MPEPIYKSKDGQVITKTQLLKSGYNQVNIDDGLKGGILSLIGDTETPDQPYKSKDGQTITTKQLLESGYTINNVHQGISDGVLSPLEKKNLGGNGSSYGVNPFDYGVQSTDKNKWVKSPGLRQEPDESPNQYEINQAAAANAEKYPGTLRYDLAIQQAERERGNTVTLQREETSLPHIGGLSIGGYINVDKKQYLQEQKSLRDKVVNENNALKTNADKARQSVSGNLKKNIDYVTENLREFTTKSGEGDVIPDVNKISDYAKRKAVQHGISDEGYYKNLLYNEAKANVLHKIIEPKVIDKFNKLYKLTYGETVEEETANEFDQGFTKDEEIISKAKVQIKSVYNEIDESQKNEVSDLSNRLTSTADEIKSQYQQAAPLIPDKETGEALYNETVAKINGLNGEFLKEQNLINSKYNARYRRQTDEIKKIAEAKIKEEAEKHKFQRSPGLQKKIEEIYKEAYSDVVKEDAAFKEFRDEVLPKSMNFARTFITSLGGAIKGLSSSMNFDTGKVFGDYLNTLYQHGSTEIKGFKDLLDMTKLSKSTGSLAGGMLPSVVAAAGTTLATGGAGAPSAISMLAGGVAAWSAETADITGRMYEDKFAETGSAATAEKAAKQTLDSQVLLMPAYAFEGLPFLGKSLKLAKGAVPRILIGGTIELGGEFLQEYPQNLFEQAIRDDKPYAEGLKQSSLEKAKNTFLNIAPVFLLGGAGQATGVYNEAREKETIRAAAETFALKSGFTNIAPDFQNQYIFDIMQRKGDVFATAYVGSLYSGGLIDQAQAESLTKTLQQSKDLISNSEKYGLTPAQQKVYASMTFKKEEALQKAEQQADPVLKNIEEEKVKIIGDNMVKFVTEGTGDYVVMTYPNNEQYVLTTEEAEKAIKDPRLTDAYKTGKILIQPFGKRGKFQETLDEIDAQKKTKPNEQETLQDIPAKTEEKTKEVGDVMAVELNFEQRNKKVNFTDVVEGKVIELTSRQANGRVERRKNIFNGYTDRKGRQVEGLIPCLTKSLSA